MPLWYHFDTICQTVGDGRAGCDERASGPGPGLGALEQLAQVVEGADHGEFAHGLAVAGQHHGGRTGDELTR
ncbi:MAG: hypothetical protein EB116_19815 [Betaproteobacteria bacterium]|nr:hypothetical protein [Betaproteobacteria bacterium]